MKIYVRNTMGLQLPKQANEGEDAAYDIVATTGPNIYGDKIERPLDGMALWKRVLFVEYGTNLFIAPEEANSIEWTPTPYTGRDIDWKQVGIRYHTQLYPRSSISKFNLMLANSVGVVDSGYRNQIFVRFKYLFQPEDMVILQEGIVKIYGRINNESLYQYGDKIVQIQAFPNVPIQFERVEVLPASKRELGGFGSSGK